MSEKVIVGMSGGVDSSVAAAILKERGFDVEGMYLILTPTLDSSAAADAEAVAKKLGIPFHIVDMKKEFSALSASRCS